MTHTERITDLFAAVRLVIDKAEALVLGEDPIDPPPPPDGESEFFKKVVLRRDFGRFPPGIIGELGADPKFNVHGQSFGVSFKFRPEAHPSRWAILALWDGNNPQWMIKTDASHTLKAAFGRSDQTYSEHDFGSAFVGEWSHVVIGFDAAKLEGTIWLNGEPRHFFFLNSTIGWKPGETPPLTINSTEAGHESGDLTTGELVYAVGACPTDDDVRRLFKGEE
jgi:hypothetical protein